MTIRSRRQTRIRAFILVLAVWAAIYLPELGTLELRGEEARRAMVAANMLDSGEWIVPSIAGEDYFNKPPGLNWPIAAAFAATGGRSELAARLPSVLAILAFVSMLIWTRGRWLTLRARVIAAMIFLTAAGMIERGRMIEIDPPYACLTGMAILWWLNAWSEGKSRWSMWLVACALLAYGALIKGPILGIIFYLTIGLVVWRARKLRELFRLPHLAGIALILLLCLGWVALAAAGASGEQMGRTFSSQWSSHLTGAHADYGRWPARVVMAAAGMGFWMVLLPLLWLKRFTAGIRDRDRGVFRACRLALVIGFVLLNMYPAARPRYSMPLYPLAAMLLGWVLSTHRRSVWTDAIWKCAMMAILVAACVAAGVLLVVGDVGPGPVAAMAVAVGAASVAIGNQRQIVGGYRLTLLTAAAVAAATITAIYWVTPIALRRESRRPAAAAINARVPAGETIYAFRAGYEPMLYYVREPLAYLLDPTEIDAQVRYLLLAAAAHEGGELDDRLAGGNAQTATVVSGRFGKEIRLLDLHAGATAPPPP